MMVEIRKTEENVLKLYKNSKRVYEEMFKIHIDGRGITVYKTEWSEGVKHYIHLDSISMVLSEYEDIKSKLHLCFIEEFHISVAKQLTEMVLIESYDSSWKLSTELSDVGELCAEIDTLDQ